MNYAGLDVHKDFVQACVLDKKGKTVLEKRFETTSLGIKQLQTQLHGMRCVMESSTSCFAVYDALRDANIQVRVAHPLRVKAIASVARKLVKIIFAVLSKRCTFSESALVGREGQRSQKT
jgi:transposase